MFGVVAQVGNEITGGLAGIAIVWANNFTMSLNFNVLFSTDLEAKLTSLERIMEYSDMDPEDTELLDEVCTMIVAIAVLALLTFVLLLPNNLGSPTN